MIRRAPIASIAPHTEFDLSALQPRPENTCGLLIAISGKHLAQFINDETRHPPDNASIKSARCQLCKHPRDHIARDKGIGHNIGNHAHRISAIKRARFLSRSGVFGQKTSFIAGADTDKLRIRRMGVFGQAGGEGA